MIRFFHHQKRKIIKIKIMTNLEATTKVKLLLINNTVDQLAKAIGISKPTIYTRLSEHNWKLGEKAILEKM